MMVYPIYNAVLKGRRPVVQKEVEEVAPEEFCELKHVMLRIRKLVLISM